MSIILLVVNFMVMYWWYVVWHYICIGGSLCRVNYGEVYSSIRIIGDDIHIMLSWNFRASCISKLGIGDELVMRFFSNINLTTKLVSRIGNTCLWRWGKEYIAYTSTIIISNECNYNWWRKCLYLVTITLELWTGWRLVMKVNNMNT